MSEEFDKEAEREKLREQFASEEEEREQTRRMSELLLKGATMTNGHCERCGDPIFRQNGQEFCPSCQGRGQAAAQQQQQAEPEPETEQSDAARVQDEPDDDTAPEQAGRAQRTPPSQPTGTSARDADPRTQNLGGTHATGNREDRPAQPTRETAGADEFEDAAAAIEETIRRFSAAAANTDDPERAREYLRTVREATDTLATLRGR